MSCPSASVPPARTVDRPAPRRRVRIGALALLLGVVAFASVACDPVKEAASHAEVNEVRAAAGVGALGRTPELDAKARAQADRMAAAGSISHSKDLAAGVSAGWRTIGENVAAAGTIEAAQAALEGSPKHLENMLNPAFTEMGLGVTVAGDGTVYVVQVFVGR
jgi:uncharacterized protein YkwD